MNRIILQSKTVYLLNTSRNVIASDKLTVDAVEAVQKVLNENLNRLKDELKRGSDGQ